MAHPLRGRTHVDEDVAATREEAWLLGFPACRTGDEIES
jgi:hypothetical protein